MTYARTVVPDLPPVRGRLVENAPLGTQGWFQAGGSADILFKPADEEDLIQFLTSCPQDIPVTVLGVQSNTIVRDGGVRGVVVKLGRAFSDIDVEDESIVQAGAAALDVNVAMTASVHGIGGLEFLVGIPGSIGGGLRMNAGAYGREIKDILKTARAVDRAGQVHLATPEDLDMRYRTTATPADWIFLSATLKGTPDSSDSIEARMTAIKTRRAETQPLRVRTGGSTFANPSPEELEAAHLPPDMKAWQLIDKAGCRGLRVGDAVMAELHCNFMVNMGAATATELETLGEEVRRRVLEKTGILLRWEVRRIGDLVTAIPALPERIEKPAQSLQ